MPSSSIRQCVRDVTLYLVFLIAITALGPLQFGFHLAELNAPQDVITCKKKSVTIGKVSVQGVSLPQCIPMDDAQFAIITSIFTLGGLLGALSAGPISTKHGRLLAMRISCVFFILGSVVEALAINIPVFSIGRLISGVGAGTCLVVVPIYISEIAPPRERGLFGVMTQISINVGLLAAQIPGYYLSRGSLWRVVLAIGIGLGLLQLIGLCFVPESPAWIAANKDAQQGLRILQRIRGKGVNIDEEIQSWDVIISGDSSVEAQGLLSEPDSPTRRASTASNGSSKSVAHVGILGVIRDPLYRPAIIAVVGVMCAQQFTGINSVMMYSVSLLSEIFPSTSALLTIMISVVNLITTILCAPLADKLGRKPSILISISGMGLSALALAFSILFAVKTMSAVSVMMFVGFFAVGLGPIPFILASELVGQEARGATQSWALGASWIATFLVAQFFPIINTALGGRGWVYFIFAAFALLSFLFVAWWVPETKGKKDADEVWGRNRRVD